MTKFRTQKFGNSNIYPSCCQRLSLMEPLNPSVFSAPLSFESLLNGLPGELLLGLLSSSLLLEGAGECDRLGRFLENPGDRCLSAFILGWKSLPPPPPRLYSGLLFLNPAGERERLFWTFSCSFLTGDRECFRGGERFLWVGDRCLGDRDLRLNGASSGLLRLGELEPLRLNCSSLPDDCGLALCVWVEGLWLLLPCRSPLFCSLKEVIASFLRVIFSKSIESKDAVDKARPFRSSESLLCLWLLEEVLRAISAGRLLFSEDRLLSLPADFLCDPFLSEFELDDEEPLEDEDEELDELRRRFLLAGLSRPMAENI